MALAPHRLPYTDVEYVAIVYRKSQGSGEVEREEKLLDPGLGEGGSVGHYGCCAKYEDAIAELCEFGLAIGGDGT